MDSLDDQLVASVDPVALMSRVAEQTCELIPAADGATVTLLDGDGCVVVVSAHGTLEPSLGRVTPVERTFLGRSLRSRRPEVTHDIVADDRLTAEMAGLGERLGVRSCMSIPLLHGAEPLGGISVAARDPHVFDAADVSAIESMSGFISALISANSELSHLIRGLLGDPTHAPGSPASRFLASLVLPEQVERDRYRAEVGELARPGRIGAVFQPIVDLGDGSIHAFEGLSRFPGPPSRTTAQWFVGAHEAGCGIEIELMALSAILDAAQAIPARFRVAVNLSPAVAVHRSAQQMLTGSGRDLILELTEHQPVPPLLGARLAPLRASGIRLAVDDAGAGFASLTQILRLRPDVIKLDRELTAEIDSDPASRSLTTALVRFADEIGAVTVAEGVEREQQHDALREVGIRCGQGYWFGRPAAAEDLAGLR